MGLFDKLFGRKHEGTKSPAADVGPSDSVERFAPTRNVAPGSTDSRRTDRRTRGHRMAVRLRPFVPIPNERPWRSWLGGLPRLPDPFTWPQGDDKPFHFVAQVDCSELPAELWQEAGPRRGWLAFFVGTRKGYVAVSVLYTPALGPERPAPAPWSRDHMRLTPYGDAPNDWTYGPPGWPVEVIAQPEGEPDIWRSLSEKHDQSEEPDRFAHEVVDLARTEYQPHDWETLRVLLAVMRKHVAVRDADAQRRLREANGVRNSRPPDDLAAATAPRPEQSPRLAAARAVVAEIEAVSSTIASVAATAVDAETSGAVFVWEEWRSQAVTLLETNVLSRSAKQLLRNWNDLRSDLAKRAYTRSPAAPALPAPVIAYFLERWRRDARFEIACMGGASKGYTDIADPDDVDRTALLLELPESTLFGWSWGDVENLVVAMPIDALRRGDFGKVVAGVTNGSR